MAYVYYGSRRGKSNSWFWMSIAILLLLVLLGAGGWFVWQSRLGDQRLPKGVASQVSFSPLLVDKRASDTYTSTSYKYDTKTQVLSFVISGKSKRYVVAEQSTPSQFSEIEGYYDKLLEGLNEYQTVSTAAGQLQLTHPDDGGQVGVYNDKGVLMFLKSSQDVPQTDWRQLLDSMTTYQAS